LPPASCEQLATVPLLRPGEAAEPEVEANSRLLRTLYPDLRQCPPAERRAQRRMLAVGPHLHVARPATAEPVDRDLAEAAAREVERDDLYCIGARGVVEAGGMACVDALRLLAEDRE